MYRLTERRYEKALPIFESHRKRLESGQHVDARLLDQELRECWNVGYQELKNIVIQLLDDPRFGLVAASYMENINGRLVVSEFKTPLAELYGLEVFDSPARDKQAKAFWTKAFASLRTQAGDRRT